MAKKILIVEDDKVLGEVLVRKLTGEKYEVSLVADGANAIPRMHEFKPDLVLLDIILPHMDGYQILEAKAKDPSLAPIPVIVISNSGQPVEINRVLALGVKDYLIKAQFDPQEVLERVRAELDSTTASQKKAAIGKDIRGKTIMWVEDDNFLSDLIARKLANQGAKLLHANNGEDALKILETERPDIILLDVLLPGMDGFEILKQIKTREPLKNTPIIILSNLGQKSDLEKGKNLGATKFLIKATVTLDEIVDEIRNQVA